MLLLSRNGDSAARYCLCMPHGRSVVGVDIDGVLGNQVHGVLQRVKERLGVDVDYEHVVHWDVALGDTSFVPEIADAMKDPRYILEMPVHDGAREMLEALREHHFVRLITVRPAETMRLTEEWLAKNALTYDELVPAGEALKSRHGADALIDDYPRNLAEFLEQTGGVGVLVDQPWNQAVSELTAWLDGPRLIRASKLRDIPAWLEQSLR
jgi:5'(3')-deoxyribonucleotidase